MYTIGHPLECAIPHFVTACSFEYTPVDPMSHTILNGVCRLFVHFITSPDCPKKCPNGIRLRWWPNFIGRVDEAIGRIVLIGAFRRAACKIRTCVPSSFTFIALHCACPICCPSAGMRACRLDMLCRGVSPEFLSLLFGWKVSYEFLTHHLPLRNTLLVTYGRDSCALPQTQFGATL